MTLYGYAGKLLYVDLSNQTITIEDLTEELARNYLGGIGLAAKVLYDHMESGVDPLSEESWLWFAPGFLTGTGAPMSGRYMAGSKSPINNTFNDANSGGKFGPELKKAGFDGLFIRGISDKPVYLWIHDGEVEIRDASRYWGMDSRSFQESIEEELGDPQVQVAMIGKGGEVLSNIAAIVTDEHRVAARGGTGAVMGSKNLKAIVARGTQKIPIADPDAFKELCKQTTKTIVSLSPDGEPFEAFLYNFKTLGTLVTTGNSILTGDAPVLNWGGEWADVYTEDEAMALGSASYNHLYQTKPYACANCPFACGAHYKVESGNYGLDITDRPEYESAIAFTSNCGNKDVEALFKCNEICNIHGLDTISAGSIVAWVMECYENDLLTLDQIDGIEANWGNADAMIALTEKMATGEGVGSVLKMGQRFAADYFGVGKEFLTTGSGVELGMHDPKLEIGRIRAYQYDPSPGKHCTPYDVGGDLTKDHAEKDVLAVTSYYTMASAGMCLFSNYLYAPGVLNQMIAAVTGWNFGDQENFDMGKRIYLIRHAFNIREGLRRKDFSIDPRVVGRPPLKSGPLAGVSLENEKLADLFFEEMGLDIETTMPFKETLIEANMNEVAKELYPE